MGQFKRMPGAKYRYKYWEIEEDLQRMIAAEDDVGVRDLIRDMVYRDMFFLGYFVFGITSLNHPWVVDRIYEVQDCHNNTLDLWPRGHYKSTIISFLLPIWKVLRNPEERVAWFSHTKAQAKNFWERVKTALERNAVLKYAFNDILYADPQNDSPKWTSTEGGQVKREGTYQEQTFQACGLDKKMPTGLHFTTLIVDDLVTEANVTSNELMAKIEKNFKLSRNLVADESETCIVGTYYHFNDLYVKLKKSGLYRVREFSGTHDGTPEGIPVYFTPEQMKRKREEMGEWVFATQILLKPVPDAMQKFKVEWLDYYERLPNLMNYYLYVDPSLGDPASVYSHDFTVMAVIGVDAYHNRFLVDMARDRLTLTDRWLKLREMAERYPIRDIGYEQYGMQSDIQYIKDRMLDEGCYFPIPKAMKGNIPKPKRISALVPLFQSKRLKIPKQLIYVDIMGVSHNLIEEFINDEYLCYPKPVHDDILDVLARQTMDEPFTVVAPSIRRPEPVMIGRDDPLEINTRQTRSWRVW